MSVHQVSLKEDGLSADHGIKLVRQYLNILLVQEAHSRACDTKKS